MKKKKDIHKSQARMSLVILLGQDFSSQCGFAFAFAFSFIADEYVILYFLGEKICNYM